MPQIKKMCLVLTGPYTGRTVHLNGHQFKAGRLEITGTAEDMEGLVLYMGRSYNAYLEGSPELKAAQKFWADHIKETADGERDIEGEAEDPGKPADSDVQPPEPRTAEKEAVDGSKSTEAPEGPEGSVPGGDGHEDSGVSEEAEPEGEGRPGAPPVDPKLIAAIHSLDYNKDDFWTQAGLPKIDSVAAAYGSADLTRAMIENAIPEWDREAALEAAVDNIA